MSGGGDSNIFFLFALPQVKKSTASSVVIACMAKFNPQFNEFVNFKVPYPLVLRRRLRLLMFIFLFSGCGHHTICIGNASKHHDNQHFGVVFVSSLQPTIGSKTLY